MSRKGAEQPPAVLSVHQLEIGRNLCQSKQFVGNHCIATMTSGYDVKGVDVTREIKLLDLVMVFDDQCAYVDHIFSGRSRGGPLD